MLDKQQEKIAGTFNKRKELVQKEMIKLENEYNTKSRKLRNEVHRKGGDLQDAILTIDNLKEEFIKRSEKINDMFDCHYLPKPVKIFSMPPMTEITWDDGTKTRVSATHEVYDLEKGIAMAFMKRTVYSTRANYHLLVQYFNEILIKSKDAAVVTKTIDEMSMEELTQHAVKVLRMPVPKNISKKDLVELVRYFR
jgi:seryl-tRNA synthetase